ncbi:hypothetical protein VTO73DRAFT_6801 [Trametes versicolor]
MRGYHTIWIVIQSTANHKGNRARQKKHECTNLRSQLNKVPHLSIRVGSFGLGTFAESQIPQGAFLGEYIAEIIPNPEDNEGGIELDKAQSMLNDHRHLNYFFNLLPGTYLLDAATVGNAVRCINCPDEQPMANVEADTRQVGGDMKIMFYSSMF